MSGLRILHVRGFVTLSCCAEAERKSFVLSRICGTLHHALSEDSFGETAARGEPGSEYRRAPSPTKECPPEAPSQGSSTDLQLAQGARVSVPCFRGEAVTQPRSVHPPALPLPGMWHLPNHTDGCQQQRNICLCAFLVNKNKIFWGS